MADFEDPEHNVPPPDALGDDIPSENDDQLDDTAAPFQPGAGGDDSDDESLLSEVDEAQFADFDPSAIAPDFETLNKAIKVSKRKRPEGDDGKRQKKRKEPTREKPKKARRRKDDSDDGFEGGDQIEGKRTRKSKAIGEKGERRRKVPAVDDVDEEALAPEERRRRELDRAIDAAVKPRTQRRAKKGEIDLEAAADQEIEDMRLRMTAAAEADAAARRSGRPAFHKLKMLPQVVGLLNRNTYVSALTDPETNLLEAVRFFLEPLEDGSLPAYNIQRDLFAALAKLPMSKDTLIASGIGKVVVFYTKSKRPEVGIKRQASNLLAEWTRPLLQRSDDYSKKVYETAVYDPGRAAEQREKERRREKQPLMIRPKTQAPMEKVSNRARVPQGVAGYSVVPQSVLGGGGRGRA
ncbi:MAG: hypothetical protein Q9227_004658 [Pyrenula ochraceoflavens]